MEEKKVEKKVEEKKKDKKKIKKEVYESDSDSVTTVEMPIKKSAPAGASPARGYATKKSAPKKGELPRDYFSDSDSI